MDKLSECREELADAKTSVEQEQLSRLFKQRDGKLQEEIEALYQLSKDDRELLAQPSGARAGASKAPVPLVAKDPSLQPGMLKRVGGPASDDWNSRIANDTICTLWIKNADPETRDRMCDAALAGLIGINPGDELEGMMAANCIPQRSDGVLPSRDDW